MAIEQDNRKAVPVVRFAGFTDAWEQRKLCEVADIVGGGTPSTSRKEYWDGDINWYAPAEIGDNIFVSESSRQITKEGLANSSAKMLPAGTVLFTSRAGIGNTAILAAAACTNQGFQSIVPHQGELDSYFAFSMAPKFKKYGETVGAGSTFVEVSGKQMSAMPVRIPKIGEQKAIGSFFGRIDQIIVLHQRKLDQLQALKKSLLQKMFPAEGEDKPKIRFAGFTDAWEQRKLGEFGSVSMCRRIFKNQTKSKGEVPFYKIGTFGSKPDAFISAELFQQCKRKYPYPHVGDILISAAGTIGRTVEFRGEMAYFQDSNIVWLEHGDDLDNRFLKHFYETVDWPNLEGSTITRLYNKNLLETKIAVPRIQEQAKIGDFFDFFDDAIILHQRKLEELKNLKKSLLQKMFI